MSQLRGIEADFATWRPVQGRKVLQLVFEVPIEQTQHVLDMLGIPQPGASKWCAIALMAPTSADPIAERFPNGIVPQRTPLMDKIQAEQREAAPKKSWSEYPRSQQAAILCNDPDFWRYFICASEGDATKRLKEHFRIASRKELDDPEKHGRWDEFVALYNLHREKLR